MVPEIVVRPFYQQVWAHSTTNKQKQNKKALTLAIRFLEVCSWFLQIQKEMKPLRLQSLGMA